MARALRQVADGVWTGPLGPGALINLIVVDDVAVDSGLPWSRRRLAALLRGHDVSTHVVTHAHADHLGSTAWLCRTTGASLQMGAADAVRFESGRVDTVTSALGRRVARLVEPERHRVDRHLRDGDRVGSFQVVDAPGHSPGNIVLWRPDDGVLVVGDAPINVSRNPATPRWVRPPSGLHHDAERVQASRRRLADLRPSVIVPVHGHPVTDTEAWVRAMRVG